MDNNNMNNQYGQTQNNQGYQYGQDQQMNGQAPYGQPQQYDAAPQTSYPQYQQTQPQQDEVVTMGEWLITMLISCIPCVNIIMIFVWAFGNGKKSKSNYFKAVLIWTLIWIVISLLISIFAGAALASIFAELGSMY